MTGIRMSNAINCFRPPALSPAERARRRAAALAHSPWTPYKTVQLKELVCSGLTSREIAVRLGCSRNAVIGKCSRLGLDLSKKYSSVSHVLKPRG
jgi:DNA-binding NarL/FixJ family response regulator